MSALPVPDVLTRDEARSLTDDVKADAAAMWAKLLTLYEGGAHQALGYMSWGDYCAAEFEMGKSHAYRVLHAARVVATLPQSPIGERPVEAVARELVPLRHDPVTLSDTWSRAKTLHGPTPTAAQVREVVAEQRAESAPPTLAPQPKPEPARPPAVPTSPEADEAQSRRIFTRNLVQAVDLLQMKTDDDTIAADVARLDRESLPPHWSMERLERASAYLSKFKEGM